MQPTRDVRAIEIDRRLHLRLRSDMVLEVARRARGLAGALTGLVVLALLLGRPVAGAVAVVVTVLVWVAVRWSQIGRGMRAGLGTGQRIAVAHRTEGEPAVLITDVTGEVVLGRGSALVVARFRSMVAFHGREVSFVLPTHLLTDSEAAFLEGRRASPDDGAPDEAVASELPLAFTVTEQVQQRVGAAMARAILTSTDVVFPVIVAVAFVASGVAFTARPLVVLGGVLTVVAVLPTTRAALRARSTVRAAYRVGRTVHAEVTSEALTTQLEAVVHSTRWETYEARRVTADVVLLRSRGAFLSPDVFTVHPRGLFDEDAVRLLARMVPRTF